MANLAELEQLFWRTARSGRTPPAVTAEFIASPELDAAGRLAIYHRAYWVRQERVLAETFPAVRAILGEARFRGLVAAYLRRHPSEHPAIEWVGRRLPETLGATADVPGYVAEVAQLEWARLEALLSPASPVLQVEDLRGVDFAAAAGLLCPGVRMLRLSRRALRAWREQASSSLGQRADAGARAEPEAPVCLLVWRGGHKVRERTLEEDEWAALELLRAGCDFASVCAAFGGGSAEAAARCIGAWIRDGLLRALAHGARESQRGPAGARAEEGSHGTSNDER